MPKNDNPHALRLYNSLKLNVNQETADEFADMLPLSKSADFEKKFSWVTQVCDFLDTRFDEDTKSQIRFACHCEDGASKADTMKKYLKSTTNLKEFAELFNSKESYAKIEINGNDILFIYPTCYCSYVKRVNKPVSKTWCYCTLGYAKSLFEKVFDENVDVELLESIKMGDSRCTVKIKRKGKE